MPLQLVTGPAVEPVSLAEAKLHLRVDLDDDDTLVAGLVVAARRVCETMVRRAFVAQTWDLTLDGFPPYDRLEQRIVLPAGVPWVAGPELERSMMGTQTPIRLPMPLLRSVVSVSYVDVAGVTRTLDPSAYKVAGTMPGRIFPAYGRSWPSARAEAESVAVRFVCGYGDDAAAVPANVKAAMLLLVGDWYENRESVIVGTVSDRMEQTVTLLLSPEDWGGYR